MLGDILADAHYAFKAFSNRLILFKTQASEVPMDALCAHSSHLIYEADRVRSKASGACQIPRVECGCLLGPTASLIARHRDKQENSETGFTQAFRHPYYYSRPRTFLLSSPRIMSRECGRNDVSDSEPTTGGEAAGASHRSRGAPLPRLQNLSPAHTVRVALLHSRPPPTRMVQTR